LIGVGASVLHGSALLCCRSAILCRHPLDCVFHCRAARPYENADKTKSISLMPMNGAITPPTP
jgi:hypothetical protein